MKKCSIYLRNSRLDPASYYRITQYADDFNCDVYIHDMFTEKEFKKNINIKKGLKKIIYQLTLLIKTYFRACKYLHEDKKKLVDIVIIQREITPHVGFNHINKLLIKISSRAKIFWDFDDNIIEFGEIDGKSAEILSRISKNIIVTHAFLSNTLDSQYRKKVICLPTTDISAQKAYSESQVLTRTETYSKEFVIVWVGTSANLLFLNSIINYIEKAAEIISQNNKKVFLKVVCNLPLKYTGKYLEVENITWTREMANKVMSEAHVGIMPLEDNAYTKGKGAFKLLQYMAMGLPIVGSPVGYNVEVIKNSRGFIAADEKDWVNALTCLATNRDMWKQYSISARQGFENEFNPNINLNIWKNLIE